jgi:2-polyprenyl-6-methoxyphenol hydroxylase-like FAD-dependent oxidoreductase
MADHALIIGGGIGGLATAVALRKVGIPATVFERAPEIREVGAGLSLWSNAVKALHRLGLEDRVVSLGSVIGCVRTVTARGRVLSETDIGAMSRRSGAPSLCVHRADLQRTLADALDPKQLQTGHTCVAFEQGGSEVSVRFENGAEARGTFLIGADGIHSTVRGQLLGKTAPRYAGYTAWRGIAQVLHFDLPTDVAFFALGPGTQIGLFYCGPGRIYWFVTKNAPAGSFLRPGQHKGELLRTFRGWPSPVPAVIEATEEAAIFQNDIMDRSPTWPWGHGRVTLLGDAVHPTTPNLGQGACQALEDAVILADALRRAVPVEAGLRDYEQRRRERTNLVTNQSWSLGKLFQLQNPLAIWLRDWSMRTRFGQRRGEHLLQELLGYELPDLLSSTTPHSENDPPDARRGFMGTPE